MTLPVDEEFAEFVRTHQLGLVRAATLLAGDRALAEDLVQEALIKVAQRWPRLRQGSPAAYARRVIYRDNISRWRTVRREELGANPPETASDPMASVVTRLDVRCALTQLPPRQRAVVVLRYLEDLTESQAAEVLDVSVGTIKSQHHDALRRLRVHLPHLAPAQGESEHPAAHPPPSEKEAKRHE